MSPRRPGSASPYRSAKVAVGTLRRLRLMVRGADAPGGDARMGVDQKQRRAQDNGKTTSGDYESHPQTTRRSLRRV